jgi:uncharacterized protein YggE
MHHVSKILAMAIIAALLSAGSALAQRSITVTGKSEVRFVPDEVVLTLVVETFHENLAKARLLSDNKVTGITGIVRDYGVRPGHIQTGRMHINPKLKNRWKDEEVEGYYITKLITLTIKDMFRFDDILTDIIKLGASNIQGIKFRNSEIHKYRKEAVTLAVQAAENKAAAMTARLGQTLGNPLKIVENYSGDVAQLPQGVGGYRYRAGYVLDGVILSDAFNAAASYDENLVSASGALAPGQLTINASVTVEFELP